MGNINESIFLSEKTTPSYLNVEDVIKYDKDILKSASQVDGIDKVKIELLKEKVNDLSELVKNGNGEKIILQQDELTGLVKQESERLETQRKSIEIAKVSQRRLITLNENSIKRTNDYLKIFALCMFELLFIIILSISGIPSGIYMALSIITGAIVVIYASHMYISIISRDNIYYDELSSEPPLIASQNKVRSVISGNLLDSSGNLLDPSGNLINACTGKSCCSTSTMWDQKEQKCVKIKEGYSSIADEGVMIIGKEKKRVMVDIDIMPFHNSEFEKYSVI